MAAPRENLLSLGHLTDTDRDTFTNRREHSLKKSFNRSMTLQADFSNHQSPHLRVLHLQQRWQELKDRELAAQQHNRQLLQQFEEAQGTLREMMVRTAAMKTIRMEYERYLEESSPRWQQQLKEKTQAAQRKRMDEYLKMCLKNTEEEQVTKSSVERPLLSQGATKKPQKASAPQEYYNQNSRLDYNQDDTLQSTWLTRPQPQTARFPIRVPYQPQGSSQAPPSFLPHPHPFQLQHLAATPGHHPPRPRQNPPPGWASPQPDHSWFWASGAAGMPSGYEALWGQLYMEEPPPERGVVPVVAEEAETSRAPSLKSERSGGSGSSHLSQELDIKPVRLSSGHAESSESGRDSSQTSREKKRKREKRGKAQRTSSESERCTSQESSRTSSAVVIASVPAATQTSESEASSEKSSTSRKKTKRRDEEVAAESSRMEKVAKKRTGSKGDEQESHNEESQRTGEESEEPRSENAGNQSPDEKSESCRDESGSQREEASVSVSIRLENGDADKSEQESSSSERSSAGQKVVEVKGHEKELEDGEEDDDEGGEEKEPNSQRDEEQEDRDAEDDDEGSARKNTIEEEEEEETGAEDEMEEEESDEDQGDDEEQSDELKNEDGEIRKQASPQDEELDEDESEGSEGKIEEDDDEGSDGEEDGSREEDEEQRSDQAGELEEERDSEDSIISPQEKRPKKIHVIPEESAEDDDGNDGSKTGSSEDDSNEISDEDDIEHLLAPQTQTKKNEEKDLKTDEKPEAVCDKVEIFQISTKTDQQSDSDEFDHFYD